MIAATAAGGARAAAADELEFAIDQGRVTLIAAGVPLRDVLAEWARTGNTRFVGVGAIGAAPVSLHLVGVAEAEALRLLLQPAAGYLAARRAAHVPGASMYDRVKIRAVRGAPRLSPVGASPERRAPPPGRPVPEAPPALSEEDQRDRLQRLFRPRGAVAAATGPSAAAPPSEGIALPPITTPRPGMVVPPEPQG